MNAKIHRCELVAQNLVPLVGNKLSPNAKALKFIVKYKNQDFLVVLIFHFESFSRRSNVMVK